MYINPAFWAPGTGFVEDNFPLGQGWGRKVSGWFTHITSILHFISIIIASAPPQSIRHWILEVGDPWNKGKERCETMTQSWSWHGHDTSLAGQTSTKFMVGALRKLQELSDLCVFVHLSFISKPFTINYINFGIRPGEKKNVLEKNSAPFIKPARLFLINCCFNIN